MIQQLNPSLDAASIGLRGVLSAFSSQQLHDIPIHLHPLVILDEFFASHRENTESPLGISYSQAIRELKGHKVVSILGGSRLGTPGHLTEYIFEPLNRLLAHELYQHGWLVASGGGPGLAMEDLQACLRMARNDTYPRNCRNVVVASELNDERLHSHADLTIRSPGGNISIREQMILGLSQVALFYPGHIGTLAEFLEAALQNYCWDRGPFPYSPPLVILVSFKDYDEQTKKDSNRHFFSDLLAQFRERSPNTGLAKGESYDWLHQVILPSPERMRALAPDARDSILLVAARQTITKMEQHILTKFGGTLNAGFGKGLSLQEHYFSGAEGI